MAKTNSTMRSDTSNAKRADTETALIGVDWGTSTLRAYRLSINGQILEHVSEPRGILNVEKNAFAQTLDTAIGAWRKPGLPVILSGMIGSRQGWMEVPYLDVPASLDDLAKALVQHPDDPALRFVPGLALDPPGQAPDVMRGEETQIVGAIDGYEGHHLLTMPGTHSKWVLIKQGRITWFATFMTGELFAILKDHSILGRLMSVEMEYKDNTAFEQGLHHAKDLPGGLLQKLFSARTLPLFERLPSEGVAAYLSGLLIGTEINEALGNVPGSKKATVIKVIGTSSLVDRYLHAMTQAGFRADRVGDDAAAWGHHLIATKANLISGTSDIP